MDSSTCTSFEGGMRLQVALIVSGLVPGDIDDEKFEPSLPCYCTHSDIIRRRSWIESANPWKPSL